MAVVAVDSPLTGTLLVMQLFKQAATDNWNRAWDIVWDGTSRELRSRAKTAVPAVHPGSIRVPGGRSIRRWAGRWSESIQETVDLVIEVQLEQLLTANRPILGGEGQRLWRIMLDQLRPTRTRDGAWGWELPGVTVESAPPVQVLRDDRGRIHRSDGPALVFPGWRLYLWHGVAVPEHAVMNPESITVAEIDAEPNAEVRRVLIERMGPAIYAGASGAVEVARDRFGSLLRKEVARGEPIMVLRVVNSTPEPDGHFKIYHLRVPSTVRSPHEAVAWSFGMTVDEYDPIVES